MSDQPEALFLADVIENDPQSKAHHDAAAMLRRQHAEIASLKEELETERVRLAACGVVAMANTPETAAKWREMQPEYRSASCDDVAKAVDREMALRAENDALRADAERYRYLRCRPAVEVLTGRGPSAGVWCDMEDEMGTLVLVTGDELDAAIDAALKEEMK